jgi:hypothetical protein
MTTKTIEPLEPSEPCEPSDEIRIDSVARERAACPAWCQRCHGRDDWGTHVVTGLRFLSHQGPSFGPHISVGAEQTLDGFEAPTAFVFDLDGAELGAPALLDLARNARAAAEWCEENR